MQMNSIDSSRELKCLIIIVEIILERRSHQDGRQGHLMHVETVEAEGRLPHVVAVDVDDRDDKAFLGVLCEAVESPEKVGKGDVGDGGGVEDRLTGRSLLPNQLL